MPLWYYARVMPNLGVLTASDLGSQGKRDDSSGRLIEKVLLARGFRLLRYEVVPDDQALIEDRLRRWSDEDGLDLIVTTGGTGLTSRDVTPEATLAVIDRQAPGMAEAMRMQTLKHTPMAMLSRAVVGTRGSTLIINLPGSTRAVEQCLEVLLPVIPHALDMLKDAPPPH